MFGGLPGPGAAAARMMGEMGGRAPLVTAIGVVLLTALACASGPQQRARVDWNLAHGHARSAVGWPAGRAVYDVGVVDATIRLPGGRTFHDDGVHVSLWPEGDQI